MDSVDDHPDDAGGLVRESEESESTEICSVSDLVFESDYSENSMNSEQEEVDKEFLAVLSTLNQKGPIAFVKDLQQQDKDPHEIFAQFNIAFSQMQNLEHSLLWSILERTLLRHYYCRQSIETDFERFTQILQQSQNIIVVIGAGVSVSCGIPDFRSPKTGLYAHIKERFPFLSAPESIFDLSLFRENPLPFFEIAKDLISNDLRPSSTHHFLKWLESEGRLLRVYTQNIDTLEDTVGLERVCYCHGSFKYSTCLNCGQKYTIEELRDFLAESSIPKCSCSGVIKPDIVFFGESLPDHFDDCLADDLDKADCFVVMGSSMKVHPVSMIPDLLPPSIPQFLINKTPIYDHNYDLQLLGDCDLITNVVKDSILKGLVDSIPESGGWILFPGAQVDDVDDDDDDDSGDNETDSEACESDLATGDQLQVAKVDASL